MKHPYREGNHLPLIKERSAVRCQVRGRIPRELAGGLYVRNGGAPSLTKEDKNDEDAPAYHWFDGDGMLTGVHFAVAPPSNSPLESDHQPRIVPTFVNKFVLTDVFLASHNLGLSEPILPSIATLLGSFATLHLIVYSIMRAVFLAFCSFFTSTPLRHLSVANTSVLWHDGRALASCESGPLVEVTLPELDTVGYWSLEGDDGEPGMRQGLIGWMKEWTTAHPKRDPFTGELMLFHMTFLPPFLHYSVVPSTSTTTPSMMSEKRPTRTPRILGAPVPIKAPRMMHDCAASRTHTILLDLPLSLDPRNLLKGRPVISYNPSENSRFAVFPRHAPEQVTWFEAPPCIIFHTAFACDEYRQSSPSLLDTSSLPRPQDVKSVSLVCCRLNSPRLVYSAGNLTLPPSEALPLGAKEACELYYYRFSLDDAASSLSTPRPSHAFPLAAIPFEFPTVPTSRVVGPSRYAYGCSVKHGNFDAALGGAAKIDCLVKANVDRLVRRGIERSEELAKEGGEFDVEEVPVDSRTIVEVLRDQTPRSEEVLDDEEGDVEIRIFELPPNQFAQEASFVPRENPRGEDDGFLVFYVFDESQLDAETGEPREDAVSELWVLDAWNMLDVVAKVVLPQRVPYGLHGNWFTRDEIASQRQPPTVRQRPTSVPEPTS